MGAGDYLKHYHSGVLLLHTSDPAKRATLKLNPRSLTALILKGVIELAREKSDGDGHIYYLTEDGLTAANILRRSDLPQHLSKVNGRRYKGEKARQVAGALLRGKTRWITRTPRRIHGRR